MRRMTDCELYSELDKKLKIAESIRSLTKSDSFLPLEKIEEGLSIIEKKFNYDLKSKVIEDVERGLVIPYFQEVSSLPKIIPTVLIRNNGNVSALVNLSYYATLKDNYIDMDNRRLYALLQSGSITRECILKEKNINFNIALLKLSATIYVKMVNKVLDKLYAVNLNKMKADKINYILAKFFLIYVMGKEQEESTNNIAYTCCFNLSRESYIREFEDTLDKEKLYSSPSGLIGELNKIEGLSKLNFRNFVENFMSMFGENVLLSLEYYPAMLDNIFYSMLSVHLNKEYIFESLLAEETLKLYKEFKRILV